MCTYNPSFDFFTHRSFIWHCVPFSWFCYNITLVLCAHSHFHCCKHISNTIYPFYNSYYLIFISEYQWNKLFLVCMNNRILVRSPIPWIIYHRMFLDRKGLWRDSHYHFLTAVKKLGKSALGNRFTKQNNNKCINFW